MDDGPQAKAFSIQVDDRERGGPVLDLLQQSADFRVTVSRLKLGDYLIDSRFVFERKTLKDLVAAIIDGRLFQQAVKLSETKLQPALILEGTAQDFAGCNMRWEAIQGALVTVSLFCGVPLLRARTPAETVSTMLFAARQARTVVTGALPRHGYRPRGKRARQLFILQGLPGIGPAKARRLLERFGNVEAIINAHSEELQSVRGIGDGLAEKLRWSVEEPRREYR
jgi:ERCC4-type nuclease